MLIFESWSRINKPVSQCDEIWPSAALGFKRFFHSGRETQNTHSYLSLQRNGWGHTWSWLQLQTGWTLRVRTVWRESSPGWRTRTVLGLFQECHSPKQTPLLFLKRFRDALMDCWYLNTDMVKQKDAINKRVQKSILNTPSTQCLQNTEIRPVISAKWLICWDISVKPKTVNINMIHPLSNMNVWTKCWPKRWTDQHTLIKQTCVYTIWFLNSCVFPRSGPLFIKRLRVPRRDRAEGSSRTKRDIYEAALLSSKAKD